MYAVIKTGGKQYRVAQGDIIRVEKLVGEAGKAVTFSEVLLLAEGEAVQLGKPLLKGAKVTAEIVEQARERKITIFKYKRRKNYRKKAGHRQPYTALKITSITA